MNATEARQFEESLRHLASQLDLNAVLSRVEETARAILSKATTTADFSQGWYAQQILSQIDTVRVLIANRVEIEPAILAGMMLGKLITEAELRRDWGADTVAARSSRRGSIKGGEANRRGWEEKGTAARATVWRTWGRILSEDAGAEDWTPYRKASTVSKRSGVPLGTVRKILATR
jgi:hypothetical protein